MCGIAGIITKDGSAADRAALEAMRDALLHRGPDGSAIWSEGPVGLVHTRLAIIDLSSGDHPIVLEDGSVLVGNGEVYNYVEIAAAQQVAGRSHNTGADFEPALMMLAEKGARGTAHWSGMYASASVDGKGVICLARDPFGIKPLSLVETDRYLAFASEPRALIASGLARAEVDALSRTMLLQGQYIPEPHSIFREVRRMFKGAAWSIQGADIDRSHTNPWLCEETAAPPSTMDEAVEALDPVLERSVRMHQRSEAPYGMFLSGGIDSSCLLAMMARLNENPVVAYTCGFSDGRAPDERPAAAAVAKACGAEHCEIDFTGDDFWAVLPQVAWAFDEPVADYAILPTWALAREARRDVKVVLSGEGGDEIFGGYGRYRKAIRPWPLGKRPKTKGLFRGRTALLDKGNHWMQPFRDTAAASRRQYADRLQAVQAADINGWLPADLLLKLDRALMAHGVEGRTPFLDPQVAAFGFPLPREFKIENNLGKAVLRYWLARHCPAVDAFARKKGFTVPVGDWISRRADQAGRLVSATEGVREICRPEMVRNLFHPFDQRRARQAWALLFWAVWHKVHIEGVDPKRDTFELLQA